MNKVETMLLELKDTSEFMVDLAYSSLMMPAIISNRTHAVSTGSDCLMILLASSILFLLLVFLLRMRYVETAVAIRRITQTTSIIQESRPVAILVAMNIIGTVAISPAAAISGAVMLSTSQSLL